MDALAKQIVDTLRSAAVGKIGFRLSSNLLVAPFRYWEVANCIESGKINVKVGGLTDPKRTAEYQHFGPKFTPVIALANGTTATGSPSAENKATFVHESTHAEFDISMAGQSISNLEGEFSAYLAESAYICAAADAGDQNAQQRFAVRSQSYMGGILIPLAKQVVKCSGIFNVPAAEMNKAISILRLAYDDKPAPMLGVSASPPPPPMVPDN